MAIAVKASSKVITSSALFVVLATPAVGQTAPVSANRTEGSCQLGSRTVAGVPYTGMQETVHTQTLADGTRIKRKGQRTQFYRDSQGRERQEIYLQIGLTGAQEEFQSNIMIRDPVECVVYNLHPTKHIAERRAYSSLSASQAGLVNKGTQSGAEQPRRTIPEELRPKSSTEDLGTDTIEGLAVQGTKITTTFPAGSQGNDRPIVVTRESWISQELRIFVLEKISDPRSGETIRRLTNIELTEPSADLFRVPADYQIQVEHE